jgi:hypothetical protein
LEPVEKIRSRVETQPRFKIQYPMKNHGKDAVKIAERCTLAKKYLCVFLREANPYRP